MSLHEYDPTELRRAFTAPIEQDTAECGGPAAEQVWDARHGRLSIERCREIVDHVALCPQCAESWRLAGELGVPRHEEEEMRPTAVLPFRQLGWGADLRWVAVAALLFLAVGFSVQSWRHQSKTLNRGEGESAVEALVEDGRSLPRNDFVLRWSEIEGATHKIEITDEKLNPIDGAENLTEPRYKVAAEKLANLPAGAGIFWQVESLRADGSRETSETFFVKIE